MDIIILNEKEYAKDCLRSYTVNGKPYLTLNILAKYYYHSCGYKKKQIIELLTVFIEKSYPKYSCNKVNWQKQIEKIAANVSKYTLFEINSIEITKSELNTIANIHNEDLEKLVFTLLCLAKLNNIKNPKNNNWVSLSVKEVFKLAIVNCSVQRRYMMLGRLKELSLIEFAKKNDNLSSRITFVDTKNKSEKILSVSDFRELGYVYLKHKGEDFIECCKCGRLIKNNKYKSKKYCSDCIAYIPQKYKTVVCQDCGKEFEVMGNNKRTIRCDECQEKIVKEYDRNRKRISNEEKIYGKQK